ncbi:mycofactocin-coupled SDR family oxidoreductase [Actinomycetospora straminea]|uniref:Mycofactocin-coupled SDR family oxidoreductase n=1 Tax=Actinomycetospora straminea TaxID=663607 RepID=A0ABP9DVH6_9PSEU|nr:mycofactocin-coupled SDR family oxidoreductase [Actinomycetospora straminea]MDD7936305.1 mycofactocin-coupled SDR family oxidoreductase [Actinomycetospora straminea]
MAEHTGRVAVVTGAGRGQGRSHAWRLAEQGADVVAIDVCAPIASVAYPLATTDDLDATVAGVRERGARVSAHVADVRDGEALDAAVAAGIAELGGVDIVLANAGIGMASPDVPAAQAFRDQLEVNTVGVWNTVQAAVPTMIEQGRGGAVVVTGSSVGLTGRGGDGSGGSDGYVASKSALTGLVRAWAHWLAPHAIRVNAVHPSGVATTMVLNDAVAALFDAPADGEVPDVGNLLPVGLLDPADVTAAVDWLVSDGARYVTGVALPVDAGFTAR